MKGFSGYTHGGSIHPQRSLVLQVQVHNSVVKSNHCMFFLSYCAFVLFLSTGSAGSLCVVTGSAMEAFWWFVLCFPEKPSLLPVSKWSQNAMKLWFYLFIYSFTVPYTSYFKTSFLAWVKTGLGHFLHYMYQLNEKKKKTCCRKDFWESESRFVKLLKISPGWKVYLCWTLLPLKSHIRDYFKSFESFNILSCLLNI